MWRDRKALCDGENETCYELKMKQMIFHCNSKSRHSHYGWNAELISGFAREKKDPLFLPVLVKFDMCEKIYMTFLLVLIKKIPVKKKLLTIIVHSSIYNTNIVSYISLWIWTIHANIYEKYIFSRHIQPLFLSNTLFQLY